MTELMPNNLPIWMQKSMRRTDWGVLLVLAFSLLAAWAFLLQPGLPSTNGSEHDVYRAAETARAFAEGWFYPRWSPDALGGYGAPIPNFYAPGATYLAAVLSFFVTGDPTQAVKLVYVAAFLLAGTATYAFVTRRAGAAAGVVAALLYIYSPYVGLTAPYVLGDLAGMISLALLPALLWSIDRLLRANRPFDFAYVALVMAGFLLTNPAATLAGWGLGLAFVLYTRPSPNMLYRTISAAALGAGAAGCYWLPALIEASSVHWFARPLLTPQLLSTTGLFTPLTRLDPAALIHLPQFTLGIALTCFTLVSLPLVLRRADFHRLFLLLGIVLIVFALTVFRAQVWLVGVISLCLAINASALVLWKPSRLLLPILCGLILGFAAPHWFAPQWAEASIDSSSAAQVRYEQQGFGIPTLANSAALPSLVSPETPANRSLLAGYGSGVLNKIEQTADLQVGVLEHGTHQDRFQVQTFAPLTLNVLTSNFPGWSASFNGNPLPISQSEQGLISVTLPGNRSGELIISLGATPTRTFAWVVSWAAILLLLGITIRRSRQAVATDHYQPLDLLKTGQARLLAVLLAGFGVVLALVAFPSAPLNIQFPIDDALPQASRLENRTDSGLELLAYQVDKTTVRVGERLDLALYWQAAQTLSVNYQVRVSLLDLSTGAYRLRTALRDPGGLPTLRWIPRRYVPDLYTINPSADMPRGSYSPAVEVCALDCVAAARLSFFGYDGNTYGSVLVLPIVLSIE